MQIPLMICCYCHPTVASCQTRETVTEAFLRLALPPHTVDAAAAYDDVEADDDRRVGIWKAPLPDGTAELIKFSTCYVYLNWKVWLNAFFVVPLHWI